MHCGHRSDTAEVVPEGARKCRTCGTVKPLEAFRLAKSYVTDGYRLRMCRICEKVDRQDWYHNRGGREVRRESERGKRREHKPQPSTPLQRLQRLKYDARYRIKRLKQRIEDIDREIARMRGDVA